MANGRGPRGRRGWPLRRRQQEDRVAPALPGSFQLGTDADLAAFQERQRRGIDAELQHLKQEIADGYGAPASSRTPAAGGPGFAVVDLETTGLSPVSDRVVEVAVVQLSADAEVTGEFCTLINPGRDVGPTRIHGLRAADVRDAPAFADAASSLWQLLSGRVMVAHNASFDARFLQAEFTRCGLQLPPVPGMCTMQLASSYLSGLPARNLAACCAAAGIQLTGHHSALADAHAAAALLACYRRAHRELPRSWAQALSAAARSPWQPAPRPGRFQPVTRRQQAQRPAAQRPALAAFTDRLPRGTSGNVDAYLGVLDRILEDRIITEGELASLAELAAELGLTRDTAERANREYLQHVAAAAWRDGHLTSAERADLLQVAHLLDVPASEATATLEQASTAPARSPGGHSAILQPGDKVVFTGSFATSRAEIEALATAAALRVTTSVSGKTALLIAADPYSQSGKAEHARQLGIRMVTEQVFLYLIDQMQGAASSTLTQEQQRSEGDARKPGAGVS